VLDPIAPNPAQHQATAHGLNNLPRSPQTLIGRQAELELAKRLILDDGVRLLTLTGPAGVGKTRLALEAAGALLGAFPDGAWFADLSPINDPRNVPCTVAVALGFSAIGEKPDLVHVESHLRSRQALLVLDNFEQVIGAAYQVNRLLVSCPGLVVIVTSREPLSFAWERQLPVRPLDLPTPDSNPSALAPNPAVALFLERARHADPGFRLTFDNAGAVARLCARLDGLPLALELAAARCNLLPPAAMLERLEAGQPLLAGRGEHPERHRSLRSAFASSFELLSEAERIGFARLGVFAGGWSLEAAQAVISPGGEDTLTLLAALADHSLIQPVPTATEARFTMLETLRTFALEALEAADERHITLERHATFFRLLTERGDPELRSTARTREWLERYEREHDNLRAALRWLLEHQPDNALRLATDTAKFWHARGYHSEARRWLQESLDRASPTANRTRARTWMDLGSAALDQGDYPVARRAYEASLEVWRAMNDRRGAAGTLMNLGLVAKGQGDREGTKDLYEQCLVEMRELADEGGAARVLCNLGGVLCELGRFEAAVAALQESLSIARRIDDLRTHGTALVSLGIARLGMALPEAVRTLEEALSFAQARHEHTLGLYSRMHLGLALTRQGTLARGGTLLSAGLREARNAEVRDMMLGGLDASAEWALTCDDPMNATRLLGASQMQRRVLEVQQSPNDLDERRRLIERVRRVQTPADFETAWILGEAMTLEAAVELALAVLEGASGSPEAVSARGQEDLTPRELEVLRFVADGNSSKVIAGKLELSPRTVDAHLSPVYGKLGVRSRTAAVARARSAGLL
jgi:predicted ATPase/DNA-binding CsgD family transcriptional regulator